MPEGPRRSARPFSRIRRGTTQGMSAVAEMPRWNLSSIFPSLDGPEFDQAFRDVAVRIAALEGLYGDLGIRDAVPHGNAASAAERALAALGELAERQRVVSVFLGCQIATDSRNEAAQARMSELQQHTKHLAMRDAEFTAWIGAQDVEAMIASSGVCGDHAFALRKAKRKSQHLMSAAEESLAADLGPTGAGAWARLHGNLSSQIEVDVELADGVKTLPMSGVRNLAFDPSRDVRRIAFQAEIDAWKRNQTALAAALNGVKGEVATLAQRRGWASPLDEALFQAHIDSETLDAMLGAAQEFFPVFRRYLKAKARALGVGDALEWYDLFAPLRSGAKVWPYPEGAAFVAQQFRTYSDSLGDFADRAFREDWIDVPPAAGKRDGAFCTPVRADESRILMNYKPSFGSVSTLAHELGHAYHNLCLSRRSPLLRDTPMTLAETASIFCETIVKRAAVAQGSPEEQLAILEASLMGSCQVVVDISSRFRFERATFEARARRELSASELCRLMRQSQEETYGEALAGTGEGYGHAYMWAAKPHYYGRSFYNFPYMYGLLFGLGLYAIYERDPDAFRARYDDLLSSTGLADAAELGARFGIDVRSGDFWRASLRVIEEDVARFERLVG